MNGVFNLTGGYRCRAVPYASGDEIDLDITVAGGTLVLRMSAAQARTFAASVRDALERTLLLSEPSEITVQEARAT